MYVIVKSILQSPQVCIADIKPFPYFNILRKRTTNDNKLRKRYKWEIWNYYRLND